MKKTRPTISFRRIGLCALFIAIALGYGGVCVGPGVQDVITGSSNVELTAPSNLITRTAAASQVVIAWTDNSTNEEGFKVERSTDGSNYELRSTTIANVTSFTDTAVVELNTYYYRVAAFKGGSFSPWSNGLTVNTPWTILTLATVSAGGNTPLATDSNNKIHICYFDISSYALKYITNLSGDWTTSVVDQSVGEYASFVLDRNNKAHIAYYDRNNVDLKYATNTSGSWRTYTVDADGFTGFYSSIAVDFNNKVHMAYYNNTSSDLKYATNASGAWVSTTVDAGGDVGMFTGLALDVNNKAHISYYDQSNGNLKYATNSSGNWQTFTIDGDLSAIAQR